VGEMRSLKAPEAIRDDARDDCQAAMRSVGGVVSCALGCFTPRRGPWLAEIENSKWPDVWSHKCYWRVMVPDRTHECGPRAAIHKSFCRSVAPRLKRGSRHVDGSSITTSCFAACPPNRFFAKSRRCSAAAQGEAILLSGAKFPRVAPARDHNPQDHRFADRVCSNNAWRIIPFGDIF
jgi:hypothetical protein